MSSDATSRICDSSNSQSKEEDMDVPEIVEVILEVLFSGLRDTDTVVRWSAAKGIGRITSRLTHSLADEILSLELFSPREDEEEQLFDTDPSEFIKRDMEENDEILTQGEELHVSSSKELLCGNLTSPDSVVHSYAAICIEKLLPNVMS